MDIADPRNLPQDVSYPLDFFSDRPAVSYRVIGWNESGGSCAYAESVDEAHAWALIAGLKDGSVSDIDHLGEQRFYDHYDVVKYNYNVVITYEVLED